jgi:hypothetical protein
MICLILEVSRRVGSARLRDGVESRLIQERRERGGVKSGRISNKYKRQSRTRAGYMLKQAKQRNYGTIVGGRGDCVRYTSSFWLKEPPKCCTAPQTLLCGSCPCKKLVKLTEEWLYESAKNSGAG